MPKSDERTRYEAIEEEEDSWVVVCVDGDERSRFLFYLDLHDANLIADRFDECERLRHEIKALAAGLEKR